MKLQKKKMPPDKWQKIKEIFNSALDYSGVEREKYLAEACSSDTGLRRDVEILLHSYEADFMESPVLANVAKQSESSSNKIQVGDNINHYKVLAELGKGGMGEVFLAEDTKLYRKVAIKFLKFADEKSEKQLKREARISARLNHPNICTIFEIGETENQSFMAMEYIEGDTLDILIDQKKLTVVRSLEIIQTIADALAEAHANGVIHRDIKPSNVIVTSKGQVKVLDFGLAKRSVHDRSDSELSLFSKAGVVAGTVSYMSPEQARGQEIDARTDIWSLGVVFYEMLTGRLPFGGESKGDIIASILTKEPPKLKEINVNFHPAFDKVIGKALEKNCDARYGSIKEFLVDTARLKQETTVALGFKENTTAIIPIYPVSTEPHPSTSSKIVQVTDESTKIPDGRELAPKFVWKWLVPAVLAISVLFGGVYWKFFVNSSAKIETFSADSRNNWQVSTLISQKRNPSGEISEFRFSPDGKLFSFLISGDGTKDIFIKQADQGEPKKLTDSKWTNFSPVWSPDGQKIAFVSNRENKVGIWSIPYLGGTPILLTPIDINSINFRLKKWSNDSKRIFFETGNKLKIIELETGKIEEVKLPEKENTGHFAISNDEKLIAFTVAEGENQNIWLQTLGTDDARQITSDKGKKYYPYFFPDNHRIVYSSDQQGSAWQMFLIDIDDLQPIQLTLGDSDGRSPIVSPDGAKIIFYSNTDESNLFSFDLKTKKEAAQTTNAHLQLFPQLSPQADKIVFQSAETKAEMLNSSLKIKSLSNDSETFQLSQNGSFPKWSPTGDSVIFISYRESKVNIWKQHPTDLKEIQLTKKGIDFEGYQFSPFNLKESPFSFSKTQNKIFYVSEQSLFSNIWSVGENGLNEQMLTKNEDKNIRYFSPIPSNDDSKIAFTFRNKLDANKLKYGLAVLANGTFQNLYETDSLIRILGWTQTGSELLAAVKGENEVEIFKFSLEPNALPVSLAKLKGAYIYGLALSPDATKIAFTARRERIDNVYLYPLDGKEIQLTSNQDETIQYSAISWANNSDKLFYGKQFGSMQISVISDNK